MGLYPELSPSLEDYEKTVCRWRNRFVNLGLFLLHHASFSSKYRNFALAISNHEVPPHSLALLGGLRAKASGTV
jgi:hypothetical protein